MRWQRQRWSPDHLRLSPLVFTRGWLSIHHALEKGHFIASGYPLPHLEEVHYTIYSRIKITWELQKKVDWMWMISSIKLITRGFFHHSVVLPHCLTELKSTHPGSPTADQLLDSMACHTKRISDRCTAQHNGVSKLIIFFLFDKDKTAFYTIKTRLVVLKVL